MSPLDATSGFGNRGPRTPVLLLSTDVVEHGVDVVQHGLVLVVDECPALLIAIQPGDLKLGSFIVGELVVPPEESVVLFGFVDWFLVHLIVYNYMFVIYLSEISWLP